MEQLTFKQQFDYVEAIFIRSTNALNSAEAEFGVNHYKAKFIGDLTTIHLEHLLNIKAAIYTYENPQWWKNEFSNGGFNNEEIHYFHDSQRIHLKFFFFLKLFSLAEYQFRFITNKIDPKVNKQGTPFHQVYEFILGKFELYDEYKELFDFCRLIRNGVHNRGFHTAKTETINFRGKHYEFKQNKETLFFNLGIQYKLHHELLDVFCKIITTDIFKQLPN